MSVLIVAALHEEVADVDAGAVGAALLVTGPGKVRAASALAGRLAAGPLPDLVLVAGTAGALRPGLAGLQEPVRAVDHEYDSTTLEALTGRPWTSEVTFRANAGVSIGTGDRFIKDSRDRERLEARGLDLVDMESFAYVWVARTFNVPVHVVKYVTDDADENAERAWPDVVSEASLRLCEWVGEFLAALR